MFYATAVLLGIGCKSHGSLRGLLPVFFALLLLLVLLVRCKRDWIYQPHVFYFVAFLFYSECFCAGFLATQFVNWRNQWNNYAVSVVDQKPYAIQFRVLEVQQRQEAGQGGKTRVLVEIEAVDSKVTQGKATALLADHVAAVGSIWIGIGYFQSFRSPVNRGQLDYAALMERKGIGKQLYCNQMYEVGAEGGFCSLVFKVRANLLARLQANKQMSQQTKAILLAVLLGDRTQLDKTVVASFQQLGIMHVLAVSGLHIGIFYVFLTQLTYFVKRTYRSLIILIFLWLFVFFSGFSPSVFRAVFMFTLLTIGSIWRRRQTTPETVGITLFLSLLLYPDWLFDVGFQLSYVAVLGIVWLMPLFKKAYTQNKVANYFLGLVFVSFVAQCSVLPLQLYYFHSFSFTFLLSNLVVIPMIALLLILGLSFFCFGWMFTWVEECLAFAIEYWTRFIFSLLDLLAQGNISLSNLYISPEKMVVLFVCFFALGSFFHRPSLKRFACVLLGSVPLAVLWIYPLFEKKPSELILASTGKKTALALHYANDTLTVFRDSLVDPTVEQGYRNYFQSKGEKCVSFKSMYRMDANRYLLVLSQAMPYYEFSMRFDVLYFHENCKVNGNRVLEWHRPQYVVLGKGLSKGYKQRIIESCRKKNIPFHDISEKGYWSSLFLRDYILLNN